MRLEIKKSAILVIPESDQDRAFLEDTMRLQQGGVLPCARVNDVELGFQRSDRFVLRIDPVSTEPAK